MNSLLKKTDTCPNLTVLVRYANTRPVNKWGALWQKV